MPRSSAVVNDIIAHVYRIQEATNAARRAVLDDPALSAEWQRQGRREAGQVHPIRTTPRADVVEPLEALKVAACDALFGAQTPADVFRIWEDFQRAVAELTLPDDPSPTNPRP